MTSETPHNSFMEVPPQFAFRQDKLDTTEQMANNWERSSEVSRAQSDRKAWVGLVLPFLAVPALLLTTSFVAAAEDITAPVIPAGTSVATASATLQQQLAGRVQEITRLSTHVTSSQTLSSSDRAALNALLATDLAGLTNLEMSSSSDSSLSQIRADSAAMVLSFHVYALVQPIVGIVLRLDSSRASAARIAALIPSIKTTIVASAASSGRLTHANQLLTTVSMLAAAINNSTYGLGSTLLSLTPNSVPGSLAVVRGATTTAATAEHEVRVAYSTIGRIVSLVSTNAPHQRH